MSQLPDSVRHLTTDIRKSYEDLIKSKRTEVGTDAPSSSANNRNSANKNEKIDDDDDDNQDEYDDDNEFENEDENGNEDKNKNKNENERQKDTKDRMRNARTVQESNIAALMPAAEEYDDENMFFWDVDNAVKRVLELKDENDNKKKEDFLSWKIKKDKEMKEKEEKDVSVSISSLYFIKVNSNVVTYLLYQ